MKSFVWILFCLTCSCLAARVRADLPPSALIDWEATDGVVGRPSTPMPIPTCDAEPTFWDGSSLFLAPDGLPSVTSLLITDPADGEQFEAGSSITIEAAATDLSGLLDVVEFYANGRLIGTSHVDFCPPCQVEPCPLAPCMLPPAGTTLQHQVVWERPGEGKYVLEARALRPTGETVVSSPVQVVVVRAAVASLAWVSPAQGTEWSTPGGVPLEVTAVDPDGEIRRVEFVANGSAIGVSEILTRDVEIPGRPRTHRLTWTNPPAGTHALQAKAVSDAGHEVSTEVRRIIVVGEPVTPVVWLESVEPRVSEAVGSADTAAEALRFRIHRRGGLNRDLHVFLHTEGAAQSGVDIVAIPGSVHLPAGQPTVDVVIRPIDDRLSEGDEGLVCVLDPSPTMGPIESYRIDPNRGRARGVILDDEPVFRFQSPEEGQEFASGEEIPIRVLTTWSAGFVAHVEFVADGVSIGDSVVNFIQQPAPGTPIEHELVWRGATAGPHQLTVQTLLADGTAVQSAETRHIVVGPGDDVPVVSLVVVDGEFSEGDADAPDGVDGAEILVRRLRASRQPLTVFLYWEGTATPGVDYRPVLHEVQIPAGHREARLRLAGVPDDITEGVETVEVSIIHPPTLPGVLLYRTLAGAGQVTLHLHDNPGGTPPPMVTVTAGRPYALEGDRFNRGEFVLNRTGDLSQSLAVNFGLPGEAIRGVDYRLVSNFCEDCAMPDVEFTGNVVVFPEGQATLTLAVVAVFDALQNVEERVVEDVQLQVHTPPIPAMVGAKPPYLAGTPDRATVTVVERRHPNEAEVVLIAPSPGDVLPLGSPHELLAIAVDPLASIRRVEFVANGRQIGVSEITTEEVDIPGRLRVHTVPWIVRDPALAGSYKLMALAHSAAGGEIRSGVVPVTVGGEDPALPVVTISRGKSPAFEQGDLKSRTGSFVLSRTGWVDSFLPLTVWVQVSGTATMGSDYQWSTGFDGANDGGFGPGGISWFGPFLPVTFAPGSPEATFAFTVLADDRAEGPETVVLRLIAPPIVALGSPDILPFPNGYLIGEPSSAEGVIEDADFDLPFITLTEPAQGAVFRAGQVISLAATAARPDAGVESIQFMADGQVIASVNYCCDAGQVCDCAPAPMGRPFSARIDWRGATPGKHVLTARTVLGPNLMLESPSVTIVVSEATRGSLVIVTPVDGAVVPLGKALTIDTVGQDPTSLVSTVEFFANGRKIGETCFLCVVDGFFQPGTPLHNQIEWTPEVPGSYALTAIGQFGPDQRIESAPVNLRVVGQSGEPRLTVLQPSNGDTVPVGREFTVVAVGVGREGGITDVALWVDGKSVAESHLVFFRPPRADEEVRHEFSIRLEPGIHHLSVVDLADRSVVSPLVTVYAGTREAGISWIAPPEGRVFPAGAPIPLEVEAVDPTGIFYQVEFFDGDELIGSSEFSCPTCRLMPGAVIPHKFEWIGAGVGPHFLTARATRADGSVVTSAQRGITVASDPLPGSFVTRDLPDRYETGKAFTVRLAANPDPSVAAYVVEEIPPHALPAPGLPGMPGPYWQVVSVSHDGVFDPRTGKVKFGPFLDHKPRTFRYEILPRVAVDVARFEGVGVADGRATTIVGDRELRGGSRHPADLEPADDALSAAELTGYSAAWRRQQAWPDGPNPIPVDYVSRAASLWRHGEHYVFDPALGLPPFCWVSTPIPVPMEDSAAPVPTMAGLAIRTGELLPDGTEHVTLRLIPAPGVMAFAVEETLTAVGSVQSVTAGGVYTEPGRTLRWGPFVDGQPVEVGYVITGGIPGISARGVASFDGQSVPVHTDSPASDDGTPRLVGVDPMHDGSHQISLEGHLSANTGDYELQVSTDLKHWTPAGTFSAGPVAAFARDPGTHGSTVRFYRAVQVP